jgi:hypothetical protein
MPYTLRKTNGTTLAIIQDGAIETSTDLTFVGKNYAGYGQTVNENFLQLLENFAGSKLPSKPLTGQLYFDTGVLKLKVFDGIRFKSLTITDTDNKRPSDLRLGDQWFDPIDQKLYVYNGQDFVMIGPEKTASALQSQIAGILVQDDIGSSYTILQSSVGSGPGTMTAVFSPNAFTPNSQSSLVTDQYFANVARGITLPGTSVVSGTKDTTIVGALPAKNNQWTFFGAAGSAWGLLERDALGDNVFYDSKNYIRRDEFASFSGSLTINSNDGITIGLGQVIRLNVESAIGNNQANLTNLQSANININGKINNTFTNMLAFDFANSAISIIPNKGLGNPSSPTGIPVDLGTETNRFRNGYIKNLYSSNLSTSTNGTIQGTWTLSAGSSIVGGSVVATTAVTATNSVNLQSYDNTTFVHAKIDETGFSIAQRQGNGTLTVNGVNAGTTGTSSFIGNWQIGAGATVQATTLLGSGTSSGFLGASSASGNNTIAQRTDTGGLNATYVQSPRLQAGTLESSNGKIVGQWTLEGTSTLQATYADIAERYEADSIYSTGTVMIIGGSREITVTSMRACPSVAGIISTKPAFKMNYAAGNDDTHPYIALKGRVPCKVIAPVHKGERLVTSSTEGYAEAFKEGDSPNAVLGIALEDWFGEPNVIEVMVK